MRRAQYRHKCSVSQKTSIIDHGINVKFTKFAFSFISTAVGREQDVLICSTCILTTNC